MNPKEQRRIKALHRHEAKRIKERKAVKILDRKGYDVHKTAIANRIAHVEEAAMARSLNRKNLRTLKQSQEASI